jgi:hypothetical protein
MAKRKKVIDRKNDERNNIAQKSTASFNLLEIAFFSEEELKVR